MPADDRTADSDDAAHFDQLSDSERMVRLLREAEEISHVGGWDLDFLKGELTWSDEVYRIHEVPLGTPITQKEATTFYPPEVLPEVCRIVECAIETGEPWDIELPMTTAKGRSIWVRGIGKPLQYEGKTYRIIGTFQDITHLKQAASERERLIDELRRKNEEMERFLYTVSHDLKVPLATMKGYVDQLEKSVLAGNMDLLTDDCERIRRQVVNLSRLLDQLLELSRAGRVVDNPTQIDFSELIDEALDLCGVHLAEPPIDVVVPNEVPAVSGDRERLLEVLQNLVGNAIKFSGKENAARITFGVDQRPGETVVSIRDNGIGFAKVDRERIFDLFVRLQKELPGSGVGLAIAKRIIEAHGGRIWAKSADSEKGSTFYFSLPHN